MTSNIVFASAGDTEPGLCCNNVDPGAKGASAVWYRVEGPKNGHLMVHTCNTTGGGGNDSLLQVFAIADPDRGLCQDMSSCSVSQQDCPYDSPCVIDEQSACESLMPIACSDDASLEGQDCVNAGGTPFPLNSKLCAEVTPGDPYYILLAAKAESADPDEALGSYRLTVSEHCLPEPLLVNDLCADAILLAVNTPKTCNKEADCSVPFDLSGGGSTEPATFDCPGPPSFCLVTMENDIWYDWHAPGNGRLTVETCDPDPAEPDQTPDTSLVVYDGCDCPVEIGTELVCSGTLLYLHGCLLGSRVNAPVKAGACYKIRLGGNLGGTPSGTLTTDFTGCPSAPVKLIDPPEGAVDARQPHPLSSPGSPQGIQSITVSWPGGTTDIFCSSYCETPMEGFAANPVIARVNNLDDTFTFHLVRPLAPGAVGTLTFLHADGPSSTLTITSHPGNVDTTGPTDLADLHALVGALNGKTPYNKYSHDIDHSGALTARDALRLIDLLTGAGGAFEPWLGTKLPVCASCCPQ